MSLFTNDDLESNPVYRDIMLEINVLYEGCGSPAAPRTGPTTGGALEDFFAADGIGDWSGDEEAAATRANEEYAFVANALNRGSYPYYRESADWTGFADDAVVVLTEYNHDIVYDQLCRLGEYV